MLQDSETVLSVIKTHQKQEDGALSKKTGPEGKSNAELDTARNSSVTAIDAVSPIHADIDELFKIYDAYQMNISELVFDVIIIRALHNDCLLLRRRISLLIKESYWQRRLSENFSFPANPADGKQEAGSKKDIVEEKSSEYVYDIYYLCDALQSESHRMCIDYNEQNFK